MASVLYVRWLLSNRMHVTDSINNFFNSHHSANQHDLLKTHTPQSSKCTLPSHLSLLYELSMVVHVIVFVVILEQGRVYSCGENKSGQLGTGEQSASAPVVIPTKV